MKTTKWLKWKIGGICALTLAVVFQTVRSSPQFELQRASAAAPSNNIMDNHQQDDPVLNEWLGSQGGDSSGQSGLPDRRQGRHGANSRGQSGSSLNGSSGSDGSSRTDTGTGRS